MNAAVIADQMITREIDLRTRMIFFMARVESEAFMLQAPGLSPDAIARTVARLKAAIAEAGQV